MRAASAVETATTSGTASPRAWGQVMTITVTVRSRANAKLSEEKISQKARVIPPAAMAMMVSTRAARLARSWVLDLLSCASRTSSITWARKESLPSFRTSMVNEPSPLTDPPITSSPGPLETGLDSPVSMASFTEVRPSVTTPSTGTFSPGFTSTRSPTDSSATGTSSVAPSDWRR
ncbi:hypothetical protein BMS3Abin01_01356 [bacterium BMS3Abin01]|nr:hypothetical protein BMS3Abin01_01356 [bacterium BMS3Abin01]